MTNKNIKIKDNFLKQEEFDKIQKLMMAPSILPWYYNDAIVYKDDIDKFQFIHVFYLDNTPQSPYLESLNPILNLLQSTSILTIKANLLTRTSEIVQNRFHNDVPYLPEEKRKQWTTSIFYVNTNNGYTKFEDGTIVESVANRMVTFPANIEHTGTSCTNERTRLVINFNYYRM